MKSAFMVAEKPSLAASLANILSNNTAKSRKGAKSVNQKLTNKKRKICE